MKSAVYTVLGWLAIEPMNGYEIKKNIEKYTSGFWSESPGQLYPALKICQEKGLIDIDETETQKKGVYKITDEGREVLSDWLALSPEKFTQRNELLLKVFFAGSTKDKEVIIEHLEDQLSIYRKKLKHYRALGGEAEEYAASDPDRALYFLLISDYSTRIMETCLEWCRDSLEKIRKSG